MVDVIVERPHVEIISPPMIFKYNKMMVEICARNCYKSEEGRLFKHSDRFLKSVIQTRGHVSVADHAHITVRFFIDRACSHQLVRHRIAAYSQESQRYCNYGKNNALRVVGEPDIFNEGDDLKQLWIEKRREDYEEYLLYLKRGVKPEAARTCLPNATKTEICSTFDLTEWRHIFKIRALSSAAQWQIRAVMQRTLIYFDTLLPAFFSDQMRQLRESKDGLAVFDRADLKKFPWEQHGIEW